MIQAPALGRPIKSLRRTLTRSWKFGRVSRPLRLRYAQAVCKRWSPLDNVFHCCLQKTGSQWFARVFRDPIFYRYTGLDLLPHVAKSYDDPSCANPFPSHTVVGHLYVDYWTYAGIPKPPSYRSFAILRDPRDSVVSFYYSMLYSHNSDYTHVRKLRDELRPLDDQGGMKLTISRMAESGFFRAQRTWMAPDVETDPRMRIFRYEDFASDNGRFLKSLLDFLGVEIPEKEFLKLYERHSFAKRSGGRAQGVEDISSHYRKGVVGDWSNHFTDDVMGHFRKLTGDTVEALGYQ